MTTPEFEAFPSIHRLTRDVIVTEKIDGTNACVYVPEDDGPIVAGSRSRWLTANADGSQTDNFGFARWVAEHADELRQLGPGRHFGEWWGAGIQRRYGLAEKRFSLFNVHRWGDDAVRPACCHVVPVLLRHTFDTRLIDEALDALRVLGSKAAPGFMQPEGVVVFHAQSGNLYKKTLDKNDGHKSVP